MRIIERRLLHRVPLRSSSEDVLIRFSKRRKQRPAAPPQNSHASARRRRQSAQASHTGNRLGPVCEAHFLTPAKWLVSHHTFFDTSHLAGVTSHPVGHRKLGQKSHKVGHGEIGVTSHLVGHQPQHSNSPPLTCDRFSKPSRFLVLVFKQTHHSSLNFTRRIPPPPPQRALGNAAAANLPRTISASRTIFTVNNFTSIDEDDQ